MSVYSLHCTCADSAFKLHSLVMFDTTLQANFICGSFTAFCHKFSQHYSLVYVIMICAQLSSRISILLQPHTQPGHKSLKYAIITLFWSLKVQTLPLSFSVCFSSSTKVRINWHIGWKNIKNPKAVQIPYTDSEPCQIHVLTK